MKKYVVIWVSIVCMLMVFVGTMVYYVDPFFHFHSPHIEQFYYPIGEERSYNNGITRNFEYDAIITGTSMVRNFKTSEVDELYGVNSIKIPFCGASYKEVNDAVVAALKYNPQIRLVIRGLDKSEIIKDKDIIREDLGKYPTYLYDDNIFNDVNYIMSSDVIWDKTLRLLADTYVGKKEPGILSFDEYDTKDKPAGRNVVLEDKLNVVSNVEPVHLGVEEEKIVRANVAQNVIEVAKNNPNTEFYYFLTPYSCVWWKRLIDSGSIYQQMEAEKILIEECLKCDNIKLFCFDNRYDITTDLNNYVDVLHYSSWINQLILVWMIDDKYIFTEENYIRLLDEQTVYYMKFDYEKINIQIDYEDDALARQYIQGELLEYSTINNRR